MRSTGRSLASTYPLFACLLAFAAAALVGCARNTRSQECENLFVVKPITDPMEGFNRPMFGATDEFLYYVARPVTRGYMAVAPEGARESIQKFETNLKFPVRVVNCALQGKFLGAAQETGRFAVNTTVGVLGFFDPATRMGLPLHAEDFGQTFGSWGMGPGSYVFLPPFFAPSSGRDTLGGVGDLALNPATYLPGAGIFFGLNKFSFNIDRYESLRESESDPYWMLRDFWAIAREQEVADFHTPDSEYANTPEPSLSAVFLSIETLSPNLALKEKKRHIHLADHDESLPYSLWLQSQSAPVVYILPGQGGYHNGGIPASLGEIVRRQGFNAVALSSPFTEEFLDGAATEPVPGFTPADAEAAHAAIQAIDADLRERYPDLIGEPLLLGASLGGMHTLYLAATESQRPDAMRFGRYVAVNPPIDLIYASQKLDDYYAAPEKWPAEERHERIWRALMKGADLFKRGANPAKGLPFDETESQFLIGTVYHWTLRNTIYQTQRRHDLGVVKSRPRLFSRERYYREINQFSYQDYMDQFVGPWFQEKLGIDRAELERRAGLRWLEDGLRSNDRVRALMNQDDFINRAEDQGWLQQTLGERATMFPGGGHMGNLYLPVTQSEVIEALKF